MLRLKQHNLEYYTKSTYLNHITAPDLQLFVQISSPPSKNLISSQSEKTTKIVKSTLRRNCRSKGKPDKDKSKARRVIFPTTTSFPII